MKRRGSLPLDPELQVGWLHIIPQPLASGGIGLTLQVNENRLAAYAETLARQPGAATR
ncbi:MAG: hypothetical protein IPO15_17690 [Anaerolineae bacterium]|uniref:hypothetical protein n=1 Tax=Candidatus Amarolinea dominans TaxID=3140696 RepID=UPI003135D1D6|nr:hypothetical protein [Anaerolineae bacterium]